MPHLRGSKVLLPKQRYSEERKAEVLRAYQERSSLRGLNRTFGITRKTITQWLKKTPAPARWVLRPRDPLLLQKDWWHDRVTHWFIVEYNRSCSW